MAKIFESLSQKLQDFIEKQPLFFVGSARAEGTVNVSPKGMDTLRVLDANQILWVNLTGSGNETAAHLLENNRITLMFCAFEGKPLILRIYGKATIYHDKDTFFQQHIEKFPPIRGARQLVSVAIDRVQTSCGYAVPLMEFQEDRSILTQWTDKKSDEEIRAYWKTRNMESIDGFDTGMSD